MKKVTKLSLVNQSFSFDYYLCLLIDRDTSNLASMRARQRESFRSEAIRNEPRGEPEKFHIRNGQQLL